jgi:predicted regulator of Ras-like GTPase activity (Roadblock/LC7/MglB family)
MSSIHPDIREKMMHVLKEEENKTDLENLAVLDRVGMKVASADSSELDADATSASSTALIDLGLRLNQATHHGALTEILLHNSSGYSILMAINEEFIVFGGLSAVYRIGYYLGYLREVARKLNKLISGDKETEMVLSLGTSEMQKIEKQREEDASMLKKPSAEQDKAALDDLLGFLDDWEKEDKEFEELEATDETNIVSIPKSIGLGIEKEVKNGEIIESSQPLIEKSSISESQPEFKVYDDEVPPIPLDDYAPMEIEEEPLSGDTTSEDIPITPQQPQPTEVSPPSSDLPSLEELAPPDFDIESSASEYDTEFVLEEESEALGSVLKELGWSEDED